MSLSDGWSRKRACLETCDQNPKKPRLVSILDFPDEILVEILCLVPKNDLIRNVRFVCVRFQRLVWDRRLVWNTIKANGDLSTKSLVEQISSAPFLKHLSLKNRNDVDEILRAVLENCKTLVSLEIVNCQSSRHSTILHGIYLSNLLVVCRKLRSIRLTQVRFGGRYKFFRLLSTEMKRKRNQIWSYSGPITAMELRSFFQQNLQRRIATAKHIKLQSKNGVLKII